MTAPFPCDEPSEESTCLKGRSTYESRGHGWFFQHGIVAFLGFCWRDVADGLQQPAIVEPVDPFQRRELDGLEVAPWSASMDDLGLVKAVDRLCESIFVAVTDAAHRRFDPGLRQALGVSNADVLATS